MTLLSEEMSEKDTAPYLINAILFIFRSSVRGYIR